MKASRARLLVAIVVAWALCTSVAVYAPQASAASTYGYAAIAQPANACHGQPEGPVPATAKLPACCLVHCSSCSGIPAAPSAPARSIPFIAQPLAAETAAQPAGHHIHPDPHPPRV
jgi:hypothetical protein